jgi:hypothetical protein
MTSQPPHKKQKLDPFNGVNAEKLRKGLEERPLELFSQRDDIKFETRLERYPDKIYWGSLSS